MGWRMRVFLIGYDLVNGLDRHGALPRQWWRQICTHAIVWTARKLA